MTSPTSHSPKPISQAKGVAGWSVTDLPGLEPDLICGLEQLGIRTTLDLLRQGTTPSQQVAIAAHVRIPLQAVQKWITLAHLSQVPSVGCQHCGLLLHAGVSSVAQLTTIPVARLHRQVMKLHVATMQRKDLCPSVDVVSQWIQQARLLHHSGAIAPLPKRT